MGTCSWGLLCRYLSVCSVLGRSWEDLALDSAPRLADVLFWIFVIALAVAITREICAGGRMCA